MCHVGSLDWRGVWWGWGLTGFFSDAAAECERQEQTTAKAKAMISRCGFAFASAFGRVEVASRRVLDAGLKCRSTQRQEQQQRQKQKMEVLVEKDDRYGRDGLRRGPSLRSG